jgi:cytochrome b561
LLLRLHRLALRLRPLLAWCYVIGFGGALFTLYLVFRDDSGATQSLALALGITIWALLLFAFIRLFQSIPGPVLPGDTFFERLRARCKLALYHLLALGVVVVGLALAAISMKLLSLSL